MTSILFTGGGTAGHVVPNIALIINFLEKKVDISYIGSEDGIEKKLIKALHIPYYAISCGKLRRYWSIKNFLDPFKILLGIFQAWRYLGYIKPDIVFSKGGFVAFPVVFSAWLRRMPVVAHESDLTPGLANRLSFPFVKKIAVSFADTKIGNKTVVTGTPIRESLFQGDASVGRELCGIHNHKPCLLVIGGSLGAAVINEVVRKALPVLLETMNVIHCCGVGKIATVVPLNSPTSHERGKYQQFEYVNEELSHLYACADVVISRAGANTVYEILALKKAALFIPLSLQASRGDQIANARYLKSKGLGQVLEESELTSESLVQSIQEVFKQQSTIQSAIEKSNIKSGTDAIIRLINKTIKR